MTYKGQVCFGFRLCLKKTLGSKTCQGLYTNVSQHNIPLLQPISTQHAIQSSDVYTFGLHFELQLSNHIRTSQKPQEMTLAF